MIEGEDLRETLVGGCFVAGCHLRMNGIHSNWVRIVGCANYYVIIHVVWWTPLVAACFLLLRDLFHSISLSYDQSDEQRSNHCSYRYSRHG